ncbi:MAG: butyrate kinase [Caldisericia bacterium]|nr:butyrate kinase [Caldisericia bacterium]MDD4614318.1 butyrate kinase [Caldisericia bacterium]
MKDELILVINPGSTSTKIAIFRNENNEMQKNIAHSSEELQHFKTLFDQLEFRKDKIISTITSSGYSLDDITAIASRGGVLKPLTSGVYPFSNQMIEDLRTGRYMLHASNLGAVIGQQLCQQYQIPGFIADPVTVDEMEDISRISGMNGMQRKSIWHALNQKHVARKAAQKLNKRYEDTNLIVVHMGGGISVGVHRKGKCTDVNNALNGDGPFSSERAGTLPSLGLVDLCFSGQYTHAEMKKLLAGRGGMVSHLGTNNAKDVEDRSENGEEEPRTIMNAMIYQSAKEIGRAAAALKGKVDSIVFTGGMAYSPVIVRQLEAHLGFIQAPYDVYPGEHEMEALALNILEVLRDQTKAKSYEG